MLSASNAEAALRRFYWTASSQSYVDYNRYDAQEDCYAKAEAEAYPYAYNTCVSKIGSYACDRGTTYTERLSFTGRPGLWECKVRTWVEAYDDLP